MHAGAPRIVSSLWRVDDRATAELMTRFYRHLLHGGARPAAALRQAQAELARDRRWADPYYWAGFVLHGDWR
jgi:CHAT domain-containing protein